MSRPAPAWCEQDWNCEGLSDWVGLGDTRVLPEQNKLLYPVAAR